MSNQLSDAKIDELVRNLDDFCKAYGSWVFGLPPGNDEVRAIVRAWLPAVTCPKRVRVTNHGDRAHWSCLHAGEVFDARCMVINTADQMHYELMNKLPIPQRLCEPVADEGGEG